MNNHHWNSFSLLFNRLFTKFLLEIQISHQKPRNIEKRVHWNVSRRNILSILLCLPLEYGFYLILFTTGEVRVTYIWSILRVHYGSQKPGYSTMTRNNPPHTDEFHTVKTQNLVTCVWRFGRLQQFLAIRIEWKGHPYWVWRFWNLQLPNILF